MKVIKKVELVTSNSNGTGIISGFIIYERGLSKDYKFTKGNKKGSTFQYLSTYPRQEDYPKDDLDHIILEAIKTEFPEARLKNKLLFSSSDTEYYKKITERPFEVANFLVEPDFSGIELEQFSNKTINVFSESINIYNNNISMDLIKNKTFRGSCDFNDREKVYDRIHNNIEFR
ncbi:hypothetical protein [Aquimarina algiphila]|uniref:Uncharacterized protein n=1 Tax=Aquimarina algiphila TaxID=2047982 RepID=A0A554VBN2_9FLAO|nr:hypothetical protein [Aquimarina algiphila]TSE03930.1 hypothetical protein FOF46_28105 [Aquimarina algiphila]